jgi:hypothetical protein
VFTSGSLAGNRLEGETAAVRVLRWAEVRTALAGVDPGLERLRLAAIGSASMVLALAVMAGVRALTGKPVTLLIFAAVLAMISNLAVNEPDLSRRRVTTLLMLGPAAAAVTAGTLLSPHRVVADVVFVLITATAVYVRRFGPRGFALGMAAFMPYFFTQFLQARPAELPWLLLAAAVGVGSTLLLRGFVFVEREDRTVSRLLRAFRAHVYGLVVAAAALLAAAGGPQDRVDATLRETRRRRARLNSTALLVADRLDRFVDDDGSGGNHRGATGKAEDLEARAEELGLRTLDVELAAERLAISIRRLADAGGPHGDDRDVLLEGLRGLGAATATGTPHAMVPALLDGARHEVRVLTGETAGRGERAQRVAFAVDRLADALEAAQGALGLQRGAPAAVQATGSEQGRSGSAASRAAAPPPTDGIRDDATRSAPAEGTDADDSADPQAPDLAAPPRTLALTTRQALQAGIAVGLSIVVGELVSPARWYWAAVAAFVVFAGTNSRGDLLSRGGQSILGTGAGVVAGMALAVLVGNRVPLALLALAVCLFLALYLVRVSQALMAFWLTAVLAVMYGLIGQFSLQTLLLRIEETVVGAAMGVLAGYLVLPRRTRDAHAEARNDLLRAVDEVIGAAVDRLLGREPESPPVELARDMDAALRTLHDRTAPLVGPWRRTADRYRDTLHVLAGVDHYARALARLSDDVRAPEWKPALQPAVDRIRANLEALRDSPPGHRPEEGAVASAEDLVDAAEAWAARRPDPGLRRDLLQAALLLRRIDQSVVALTGAAVTPEPQLSRR